MLQYRFCKQQMPLLPFPALQWLAEIVRHLYRSCFGRGRDSIMVQVFPNQFLSWSKRCRKDCIEDVGIAVLALLKWPAEELRLLRTACESRGAECGQALTTFRAGRRVEVP
jgi:hypothetical protein